MPADTSCVSLLPTTTNCHSLPPPLCTGLQVFSPNMIASMQNENQSFSQINTRKWVDRALQCTLAAVVATALAKLLVTVAAALAKAVTAMLSRGGC
jgi:hypothetical protein